MSVVGHSAGCRAAFGAALAVLGLLLAPGRALAQEALTGTGFPHRGAVGLSLQLGGEAATTLGSNIPARLGARASQLRGTVDVVPTLALRDGSTELVLTLRFLLGSVDRGGAAGLALRKSFGLDEWKTYVQLGAQVNAIPLWTVGPQLAFGVMRELSPVAALYAQLGGGIGFGAGIRGAAEFSIGIQGRSYLLE